MNESKIKEVVRGIVRESFKQSLSEESYNLGKVQYTTKNLTPAQILDLAMAYVNTPANKILSGKLGNMVNAANDLAKLTGTTQMDAKTRGKHPALILPLLKNSLVTKDEYVKLYQDLIVKQISVIKSLKNADPASRMVGGAAARQAHKDMKGEFEENVNEMSVNDVHFKNILRVYDHGGSFTKKKVATAVCKNPNASRNKIIDYLKDMDYEEILQVEDELRIGESVEGDRIQKLNDRIRVLRAKISAQKDAVKRNELQQTLKNALQSLSNVRKNHGIKTESVVAKDGKVLSNNNLIGYYEFDRDADSFWVDDVKKGKGQLSFDTKKEVEDYFKKNEKDALKHLGKLRESINEAKFPIYHNSYTSAIDSALDWANKSGFDYDKEETAQKIGLGPKKPSEGKTNRFSIELSKGGKEQRKQLHIQVYGMGNGKYELNAYIG
jgi:hypothetical protein